MPVRPAFTLWTHVRRWSTVVLAVLVGCLGAAARSAAQLPVAELAALSQSGGQAGSELELRVVAGNRIDEIEQLRFSHPGLTATLLSDDPLPFTDQPQPRYGHFRVKLADDVPPGRYEVRAVGRHGISNPRVFWVDRSAHTLLTESSHDRQSPTPLPAATWLHGRATPAEIDYYTLHLDAGQRVRIDLVSQRLDSRMIGQLTLFDSVGGQTLQSARGADDVDPHLTVASAEGRDYVLAIHDFLYRGGEQYFYQLRMAPDDRVPEPPAEGSARSIVAGQVPPWQHPSAVTIVGDDALANWLASNSAPLERSENAAALEPPCRLRGVFASRDAEADFQFTAKEGEALAIEVISERAGEPTDVRLAVDRPEPQPQGDPLWQPLVTVDDGQDVGDAAMSARTRDPVALLTVPATGNYRLRLRDLDSGEALSRQQAYWLDMRIAAPDYVLLCYRPSPVVDAAQSHPQGSHLMRGGAEAIRVLALRRDGWSGPIDVSVTGFPDGVTCAAATIAANQQATQLTLVAGEEAAAWTGAVSVIGRAEIDGEPREHAAVPATILHAPGEGRERVASRLATEIALSVSEHDIVPLSIAVGSADAAAATIDGKQGGTVTLPIRLTRREGGKTNCVLRPRDLPPGVTAAEVAIAADATDGNLELKIDAGAAVGTYSFWLQAETQVTMPVNMQALQRAEQYRAGLAKLLEDPAHAKRRAEIESAIAAANARIETAKPAAQPTQLKVFLPSPTVTLRIGEP